MKVFANLALRGRPVQFEDDLVTMNACTIFDALAFLGVPKSYVSGVDENRISFRGSDLNKLYTACGDPGYTATQLRGAAASFRGYRRDAVPIVPFHSRL